MPLSYRDVGAPAAEPVTLEQAKAQCSVDSAFTDDDELLTSQIVAARQCVEKVMQRAIYNRPMKLWLDFFPFPDYDGTVNPNDRHVLYGHFWHALAIKLPRPRCLSVESITYIDLSGATQTLAPTTYFVDLNSEPARIVPLPGLYWPYTQSWLPGSVCISYTAGSFVLPQIDALIVPTSPGPYLVQLSEDSLGGLTLVDASDDPVGFTNNGSGGLTVNASYAGQTLTASYYIDNCPQTVRQAMLLLISYWYSHRDAAEATPPKEIDLGVRNVLAGEIFDTFGF